MAERERSAIVVTGDTYDTPPTPDQMEQELAKCHKPVRAYDTKKLMQLLELMYFDIEGGYDEADVVDHLLIFGFSWEAQLADPEAAEMILAARRKYCEHRKMLAIGRLQELFEALVAGRPVGNDGRPVTVTVGHRQARVRLSGRSYLDSMLKELFAIFGKELIVIYDDAVEEDTALYEELSSALDEFNQAEEEEKRWR